MNIVFNINHLGLEGLGATLTSLIRNCSNPKELKLWFLCSDFHEKDKKNIDELLKNEKFNGLITYIDFNAKAIFGHLKPLHGDWTTYGRLLIPDYISDDTALYLDADLLVLLDVLLLKNIDFNGNILAAVHSCTIEWVLEQSFLVNTLHRMMSDSYFNAGIVFFNLKQWRLLNIEEQWKDIAEKYNDELISHDQTLLNAISKGEFTRLPFNFNNPWYPGEEEPTNAQHSIIHFVGSPKPWDLFGNIIHKGYKVWRSYNTAAWQKEYDKMTKEKLNRTWKIKASVANHIMKAAQKKLKSPSQKV